MPASDLIIRGAREHNLRDVNLTLPRGQLICLTGVSGSGKSSLAFDTLFAEGQRRYVESLSTYARHLLGQMPKPDVDLISGLSPAIAISQKTTGQNPRSTVGTITEIYDYLRVLYARVGTAHCPKCHEPITAQTQDQILDRITTLPAGVKFMVLAPMITGQKGEYRDLFEDLIKQGFSRARIDGEVFSLDDAPSLDRQMRHNIEVVVDRLTAGPKIRARLAEAVELALRTAGGNLLIAPAGEGWPTEESGQGDRELLTEGILAAAAENGDIRLSAEYACTRCNLSFDPPSPQLFSFNSPRGMCKHCDGLGEIFSFSIEKLVPDPSRSFQQGCIELVGPWRKLSRWKRHIYAGVGATLERIWDLPEGTVLETAWEELQPRVRKAMLYGTGKEHITYTWRAGPSGHKWGGEFEGIIPTLMSQYRGAKSRPILRMFEKYMDTVDCEYCGGRRLNEQACAVTLTTASEVFGGADGDSRRKSLPELCDLAISDTETFFEKLELDATSRIVAEDALKEIRGRLGFLGNVGLEYLTLSRKAPTLSGGEMQRIRLAGQIGCGLIDVLYILDEPSIGLHPRDNSRLLRTLGDLRDQGNTVVVVEHDEDTMRAADHIVDFGPGPGIRGGKVVATGLLEDVAKRRGSVTGQYLSGKRRIEIPKSRGEPTEKKLVVRGAAQNNLKDIDVEIPLGLLVCVTGVSGSGKSSLVSDILVEALRRDLNRGDGHPGAHRAIEGMDHLDKMISIDQSPIGRTPRSNPATYTKIFDEIRKLFALLPDSRTRGYKPGRFSFNVAGGRCEACQGNGANKLDMDFLADVWVTCPVCEGHRFNRETLQVRYRGKTISQVLEMDVQEALEHFENIPKIAERLQTLHDVGLDYIKLGQPSPTLSGGEAQRIKLARELVKRGTGRTLYLLDEPTTGLHFADIEMLLTVLQGLVARGNTVLVVEHNLDVVKTADWVIDLGPEGGAAGGWVVAIGTPEAIVECPDSYTGQSLRPILQGDAATRLAEHAAERAKACEIDGKRRPGGIQRAKSIRVRGARQHNLRDLTVDIPRDQISVFAGPSGSGKTSLAMDTIYAEGQRRYVESLSSYARQFVGQMQKPKVEHIEGLSPAVAIEQRAAGANPRSTVGTVTEIYDYLRILAARLGHPYCPECQVRIGTQTSDEIISKILAHPAGTRVYLTAPLEVQVGEHYESLWESLRAEGYVRVRVDGVTYPLDDVPKMDRRRRHDVELVVDRLTIHDNQQRRIGDSVETALSTGRGILHVVYAEKDLPETEWETTVHSQHFACQQCGRSFEPLTPHHFSFNSSVGWCPECEGLGVETGTSPEALIRDSKLSLMQGALAVWPAANNPMLRVLVEAFSRGTGIPADIPLDQLSGMHRRQIFHGTGSKWFDARRHEEDQPTDDVLFRFQYKGLYPAIEQASRLSPTLRSRLEHLVDEVECSACCGSRLRDDASAVRVNDRTIDQLCRMPLGGLVGWFATWDLSVGEMKVAGEIFREICSRTQFLVDVGLEYLSLGRPAPTLSGGEMQRIRLAAQIGSGLCGVLYVLDEPTIGLHPRDNRRLLAAIQRLRDLGNTLILVEHDREVIEGADHLLDFGPRAGRHGGQIVAQGTPEAVSKRRASVTGPYLTGRKAIPVPTNRRMAHRLVSDDPAAVGCLDGCPDETTGEETLTQTSAKRTARKKATKKTTARRKATRKTTAANKTELPPAELHGGRQLLPGRDLCAGWLQIVGASHNNLANIDVKIPLGVMTVVTGVSGSGKSSLVEDILYKSLARILHRASTVPGAYRDLLGLEHVNKVIRVDQNPLGQTPASNPATYTGAFEQIRNLFAQLPESRLRGYSARRFSFNVPGGRCEKCDGMGQLCIEMHFLPDVWIECDACRGKRYNQETLAVRYRGYSIADVLEMPCGDAVRLFANVPKIRRTLGTLCDVGLDYLTLGQPAPTLSGGEAQRVKLAAELSRPDTGKTLYLLDEPTTGLHFEDMVRLLDVLNRLVDLGNSVLVIEHNLDVIKTADWVIDLGPEAGDGGGQVVVAGTPEDVVAHARLRNRLPGSRRDEMLRSYTGEVLDPLLAAGPFEFRKPYDFETEMAEQPSDVMIEEFGIDAKMPWEADGRKWHTIDRVSRNGNPCRWDGSILADIVDCIQGVDDLFAPTDWNNRSVVEIRGAVKSHGWFFHAITGEEWLLKMKFRTTRGTFRREELVERLNLRPLNEVDELPLYGTDPRVRVQTVRGPWQEVEVRVFNRAEIDRPEFWQMLDQAIEGFRGFVKSTETGDTILQPWKQLERKWHLSRRGFTIGRRIAWPAEVLQQLIELIEAVAPDAEFQWKNKVTVPISFTAGGDRLPWGCLVTKKLEFVQLALYAGKGQLTQGRIRRIGYEPRLEATRPDYDVAQLYFRSIEDLKRGDLRTLLDEHTAATREELNK